jgi:lipopolysaccharide export system protein LptA
VLVALAGLGFAAALFVYGRGRERPAVEDAPPVLEDQTVTSRGSGVLDLRANLRTGRDLEIRADERTHYEDGRVKYERVHFKTTRADGTTLEIWAGVVEGQGRAVTGDEPGVISFTDDVRVKTSDGVEIATDSAEFDNVQEFATIPGHLTFTRGRLSGEGVGGTFDVQRDVLWLLDEARVSRAPDESGGGALEARAKEIGMVRPDRYMELREQASIVQPDQTLTASQMLVHFIEDEGGARLLEMRGSSRVEPTNPAQSGAPDLQANDITLEFHEDGQTLRHAILAGQARLMQDLGGGIQTIAAPNIDVAVGTDGKTLTNLEARGGVEVRLPATGEQPGRIIDSATLVASGAGTAGLQSAIFDGGVTFTEQAPAGRAAGSGVDRTATSTTLALGLDGGLDAIQSSEFRGGVSFRDDELEAAADHALHDHVKGTLLLTPANGAANAAGSPWVDTGSVRVEALWIEVSLDTHDLNAKERIRARMAQGRSADGMHTAALFDGTLPVYGTGAALQYVSDTRAATFTGAAGAPARVYQTAGSGSDGGVRNWISATQEIEVQQETGNLHAVGTVESNFMLESVGGATPSTTPTATVVNAHEMTYSDAERKAVYAGNAAGVATLQGPDGTVEAMDISLSLAKEQRALQFMVATGTMFATFDGGREAVGDRLTYDAVSKQHVITGKPMYFKNVQTDSAQQPSCSLEKSTELHYEGRDQTIHEPGSVTKALRASTPVACTQPLKVLVN